MYPFDFEHDVGIRSLCIVKCWFEHPFALMLALQSQTTVSRLLHVAHPAVVTKCLQLPPINQ